MLQLMNLLSRRTHLKLVDEVVEDVEDVGGGDEGGVFPKEGDHGVELFHDYGLQTEHALDLV